MARPDSRTVLGAEKKRAVKPWRDGEGPKVHVTQCKKPIRKRFILCDLNDVTF